MHKILLIDDNENIRENTAEILRLSNYEVITAANGKEGVKQAVLQLPDLILCDIMMPELDGYGVLHMVQNHPELQSTPFIFLSAKAEMSDVRLGMSLGADDYIPKPFDPTDLLNAVESRLKKADVTRRQILHQSPAQKHEWLNAPAGDQALKTFVLGRRVDRYKKKERIYFKGNHPIRLYYVQKGSVKIFKTNDDGKELILKIAKEGEFFGYIALLENSVYKEEAEALENCEIAAIPKSEFEELMNAHPEVWKKFIRLLAGDVSEREEQLLQIAYDSLRRKVATALLRVQRKFRHGSDALDISLSRENLAALAGTATESLIRTLTEFKAERVIDIHHSRILVLDEEKLETMIRGAVHPHELVEA